MCFRYGICMENKNAHLLFWRGRPFIPISCCFLSIIGTSVGVAWRGKACLAMLCVASIKALTRRARRSASFAQPLRICIRGPSSWRSVSRALLHVGERAAAPPGFTCVLGWQVAVYVHCRRLGLFGKRYPMRSSSSLLL